MRITSRFIPFLFLIMGCLLMARFIHAVDYEVDSSSNILGTGTLSVIPNSGPGDILGKLVVNTRATGVIAETIKIFDSSGVASGLIGTIDLSTGTAPTGGPNYANEYFYALRISSAITYTKTGTSSDITILWKNVR